jgi:S1-C subfamily serine protease
MGSGVLWRDGVGGSASAMRRPSSVSLMLPDGEQVQGTVRGADVGIDLAAVSYTSGTLPAVGRAAGASPRVGDAACAVGRDPSGLTHASFGHVGLVAGAWSIWRGGRVERPIRPDGGLHPGLDGSPVVDASGQLPGLANSAFSRHHGLVLPVAAIERALGISAHTAKYHVAQILAKVGAATRATRVWVDRTPVSVTTLALLRTGLI